MSSDYLVKTLLSERNLTYSLNKIFNLYEAANILAAPFLSFRFPGAYVSFFRHLYSLYSLCLHCRCDLFIFLASSKDCCPDANDEVEDSLQGPGCLFGVCLGCGAVSLKTTFFLDSSV